MSLSTKLLGAIASLGLMVAVASNAQAVPITGDITFKDNGSTTVDTTNNIVHFGANPVQTSVQTGDFASVVSPVTFADFDYDGTGLPLILWSDTELHFQFTLGVIQSVTEQFLPWFTFVNVTGTGTMEDTDSATLDPTSYLFSFTATIVNGQLQWTFGATNAPAPVPEPASLALFGAALAGLGLTRRRRKTT